MMQAARRVFVSALSTGKPPKEHGKAGVGFQSHSLFASLAAPHATTRRFFNALPAQAVIYYCSGDVDFD
jgi:hypothetical protein